MARGRKKGPSAQEKRRRQLQSTYDRLRAVPMEQPMDLELRADYHDELERLRNPLYTTKG